MGQSDMLLSIELCPRCHTFLLFEKNDSFSRYVYHHGGQEATLPSFGPERAEWAREVCDKPPPEVNPELLAYFTHSASSSPSPA